MQAYYAPALLNYRLAGPGRTDARPPGEEGPQVIRPGQDQNPGLVDRPVRSLVAPRLGGHQRGIASTEPTPALRRTAGPAGLRGPGGADRVQGVGFALLAAVLPVGPVHFDGPDAGRGDMPGEAGAVTAGALDPDQADGPEPAQPAQRPCIASPGGRELLDAE